MDRRSDIIFFGTLILAMIVVLLTVFCRMPFPWWLQFWWAILLPMALSKMLFPKSKFTNWLNGKAFNKKQ
jgi:hypothetical protein